MVYYLAQRKAPTRFIYNEYFRMLPIHQSLEQELIDDLIASKPAVIIVSSDDPLAYGRRPAIDSRQLLEEMDDLQPWIENHYRRTEELDRFQIFRPITGTP